MRKRTPQEKKALSYDRDRRNTFHANDKASRRLIPLGKARANRAYRKKVDEVLREAPATSDLSELELIESKASAIKNGGWEKYPETPLGEVVETQKQYRESHAGNGKTARKKIREFVAGLKIEVKQEADGRWSARAAEGVTVPVCGDTREDVVKQCKRLAGAYYLEEIGAGKVLSAGEDMIVVQTY